jgi:hypothetical protein
VYVAAGGGASWRRPSSGSGSSGSLLSPGPARVARLVRRARGRPPSRRAQLGRRRRTWLGVRLRQIVRVRQVGTGSSTWPSWSRFRLREQAKRRRELLGEPLLVAYATVDHSHGGAWLGENTSMLAASYRLARTCCGDLCEDPRRCLPPRASGSSCFLQPDDCSSATDLTRSGRRHRQPVPTSTSASSYCQPTASCNCPRRRGAGAAGKLASQPRVPGGCEVAASRRPLAP